MCCLKAQMALAAVLLFLAAGGTITASPAAGATAITWEDIRRAAQSHPALLAAASEVEEAAGAVRASRQYPNPVLGFGLGRAEATKRAVGRRVGGEDPAVCAHVRAGIGGDVNKSFVGLPLRAATVTLPYHWELTWGRCWIAPANGYGDHNPGAQARSNQVVARDNGTLMVHDDDDAESEYQQHVGFIMTRAQAGTLPL